MLHPPFWQEGVLHETIQDSVQNHNESKSQVQNQIEYVQWCMRRIQLIILVPYWWPDDTAISGASFS